MRHHTIHFGSMGTQKTTPKLQNPTSKKKAANERTPNNVLLHAEVPEHAVVSSCHKCVK